MSFDCLHDILKLVNFHQNDDIQIWCQYPYPHLFCHYMAIKYALVRHGGPQSKRAFHLSGKLMFQISTLTMKDIFTFACSVLQERV